MTSQSVLFWTPSYKLATDKGGAMASYMLKELKVPICQKELWVPICKEECDGPWLSATSKPYIQNINDKVK